MFKIKNNLSPPFMHTYVEGNRTRSGNGFLRPTVNKVHHGEHSLRSFGPILWNTMIPKNLKDIESLEKFKYCIKNWSPDNCKCTLCRTYVEGVGYTVLV